MFGKLLKVIGVIVLLFVALAVISAATGGSRTAGPSATGTVGGAGASGQKLALLSAKCEPTATSFVQCDGSVKNLTKDSMRNVQVQIVWLDAAGAVQRTDDAIIDYNPILAGQESPWKTIGTRNPALTQYRVAFKEVLGGTIPYRDERK